MDAERSTMNMDESDDDYSTFSVDNMMKVTEFQPVSDAEKAEMHQLLSVSV